MPSRFLYLAVFLSGTSVMAVEMAASRLLAPYFGTSLIVWTSLIGIIMVALTAGYWVGGRLADRRPDARTFFTVQALGGLLVCLVPFAADPILSFTLRAQQVGVVLGSFLGVSLLLAVPVGILGVTSPFAIRLVSGDPEHAGRAAGSIYALSTAGSILGTFLPGLVLIPGLGTRLTILGFGGTMVLVGLIGMGRPAGAAAALAVGLGVASTLGPLKQLPGLVVGLESPYNFIQVVRRSTPDRGDRTFLVLNEGRAVHSIHAPADPAAPLVGGVWDFMTVVPALAYRGQPMRAAVVGLAAGTMPHQWLHFYGAAWGLDVDGVELDPGIVGVGREFFSLAEDEAGGHLKVHVEDGRTFLRGQPAGSYDMILTDAYKQPYIPFHLATREYFQLVHDRLREGGVMAINVGAISTQAEFFRRLLSTVQDVFGEIRFVLVENPGVPFNNHVVLGVKGEAKHWERLDPRTSPALSQVLAANQNPTWPWIFSKARANFFRFEGYAADRVFTDDRAPIEFYTEKMIVDYLAAGGGIPSA